MPAADNVAVGMPRIVSRGDGRAVRLYKDAADRYYLMGASRTFFFTMTYI